MKTSIRILGILALAAVALSAATPAGAVCGISRLFGQFDSTHTLYVYTYMPGAATDATNVIGRFWQPGLRSTQNEGTYDDSQWFVVYPASGKQYINGNLGSAGVVGCPDGRMITLLQSKTTDGTGSVFAVGSVAATPADADWYSYARQGNWTAIQVPQPKVSSSKAGTVLTLNFTFPDVSAGNFSDVPASQVVTAFNLMKFVGAGTAPDGGRGPAAWTLIQRVPYQGTAATLNGFTFDCGTLAPGQDVFFATQLEFDNGQFLGDYVGKSQQVKCNSTQANPKFKVIDKKNP